MRKLERPTEPSDLIQVRRAYTGQISQAKAWKNFNKDEVREELKQAQDSLCAYCETALSTDTRIDHFEPKDRHYTLTFKWDNLVLSCDRSDSCDVKKDNNFEAYWVNPYSTDPIGLFTFRGNGKIKGETPDAEKIIKDFGLDSPGLKKKRGDILSFLTNELLSDPDTLDYYRNMNYKMFPTAHIQIIKNLSGE